MLVYDTSGIVFFKFTRRFLELEEFFLMQDNFNDMIGNELSCHEDSLPRGKMFAGIIKFMNNLSLSRIYNTKIIYKVAS